MVEDLTFANGLKLFIRERNTTVGELASIFGVSVRTLHYWHTGNRYPNPRTLWELRELRYDDDECLRFIIRDELDRQLPGVWK